MPMYDFIEICCLPSGTYGGNNFANRNHGFYLARTYTEYSSQDLLNRLTFCCLRTALTNSKGNPLTRHGLYKNRIFKEVKKKAGVRPIGS